MISLPAAVGEIVAPAVRAVFEDDEVTAIHLRRDGDSIELTLTAVGEDYRDLVVQSGVPHAGFSDWQERLRSNLADWVSETRFGWGQNRGV